MVALVDGQPRLLNIKQILEEFLRHRREVVTRRTVYELRKARRARPCAGRPGGGLVQCGPDHHPLIKASPTPADAKRELMGQNWRLSWWPACWPRWTPGAPDGWRRNTACTTTRIVCPMQAQAILELRLQRLTGLEQDKIVDEYRDVMATIIDLSDILARTGRVSDIIAAELNQVKPSLATRAVRKSRCLAATSISKT